jgi:uncharacterized membrane protein YjjP (DUF1212 family)
MKDITLQKCTQTELDERLHKEESILHPTQHFGFAMLGIFFAVMAGVFSYFLWKFYREGVANFTFGFSIIGIFTTISAILIVYYLKTKGNVKTRWEAAQCRRNEIIRHISERHTYWLDQHHYLWWRYNII